MLYDDYDIDEQWQKIKKIVNDIDMEDTRTTLEDDVYKFLSAKRVVSSSIRARNKLNKIRILCESLRKSILYQRQDNESAYEDL